MDISRSQRISKRSTRLYPLYPNHSQLLIAARRGILSETANANEQGYNDDATNNYYVGNYESPVQLAGQRYGYKLHKVPCETDFILSHNKRGFL